MSVGKLKVTITSVFDVEDLEDYEAETLEEAAKNTQRWIDNFEHEKQDYVDEDSVVVVEVYKE